MIPFGYHVPTTVTEALACLAEREETKVLAGGQSLVPAIGYRLARPTALVDINRLPLAGVERANGHLRLGALVRHHVLEESPEVREWCPLLPEAAALIGNVRVRTLGTLGGSLAHADPAGELPLAMIALDARLTAIGPAGERAIAAREFFQQPFTTVLRADELLVGVEVPLASGAAGAIVEFARRSGDFPLVAVAAVVSLDSRGAVRGVRVAMGGLAGPPARSTPAEDALLGHEPTRERLEAAARIARNNAHPQTDPFASAAYRAHLVEVLTRRALETAVRRARNGAGSAAGARSGG
jgi:aerobic carbon-monoxide dehydrogenase medium subunit